MKASPRNAGFSLIEVMCAVLIMGVALVGLTHGITTALSSTKDSETQTAVIQLAAGQIETLRAEAILTDDTTEGDFGENFPRYSFEQNITPADVDGLHQVEVVVKDAKSGAALYKLETLLFDTDYPATADDPSAKKDLDKSKERAQGKKRRKSNS
jgi:prepilin-type N-terminal cleavage/methylation domain-containing protein